jgi:hypothetical protein
MLYCIPYRDEIQEACMEFVAPDLKDLEARFFAGDKRALFEALVICIGWAIHLPLWVEDEFLAAIHSLPKSWDDVFGRPLPKGTSTKKARLWREIQLPLYLRVRELHARGDPIDDDLFERVGKKFEISGSTAKRIYYSGMSRGQSYEKGDAELQALLRKNSPRS